MKTRHLYEKFMITNMVSGFEPVEVKSASGSTITGTDNKKYLDCFSGIAVVNTGHCNYEIIKAAKEQMDKFIHCGTYVYYNSQAGKLAEKLAEITPGKLRKSFFGNSGAEAIEGALRIARQFTGKREIIALMHGFHGRTNATLSISGNRLRKKNGGPYASGVAFAPAPYAYRCPFGSKDDKECAARAADNLREVLRFSTSGDVGAFIAESVLGEGGTIVPHTDYFKYVKAILKEEGILFIADEVQTGFGRTGKMFGIEHSGIEPDIIAMAKGIAHGFPLSAFIVRDEIARAFKPGDHLSTFGGNPVSCAAAIANIAVIEKENLVKKAEQRGKQILGRMRKFQETCKILGDVRGLGLMIGLELVKNRKIKEPAPDLALKARTLARESGILIGVGGSFGNVLRIQPPLVITEEETEHACAILEKTLIKIAKAV